MEKLRPVIAIALCLIVWAVYFKWFSPKPQPKKPPPPVATPEGGTAELGPPKNGEPVKPPDPEATEFKHPVVPQEERILENDFLKATFTTTGGAMRSLILKKYRDPFDTAAPLVLVQEYQPGLRTFAFREEFRGNEIEKANWKPLASAPNEVAFEFTGSDGMHFRKIFSLGPEPHAIRMKVVVKNISKTPLNQNWEIIGLSGIHQEATGGIYPSALRGLWKDGETYSVDGASSSGCGTPPMSLKGITEKPIDSTFEGMSWIGAMNKFFLVSLIPEKPALVTRYRLFPVFLPENFAKRLKEEGVQPGDAEAEKLKDWTMNTIGFSVLVPQQTWAPDEEKTSEYLMYAGPKQKTSLAEGKFADYRLRDALDFGWFEPIAVLLLWILNILNKVFGNYGVAIIGLVLIVRMAIYPISKKGQVSMFRMQKLQPQIKAIQEKYKGDPVKTNQESMKLMKEQGVNPFGGCLPMFLQIPIFLGLYNALLNAIQLRQEPFFAWIRDLSQPDRLFELPFSVFGATHFHLLPLVMIGTWFTQAYLAPRSPDPQMAAQQKMFMIMPVVIGFMMYSTPSGLVLYWLVSTAWGIAEQQFIKRVYLK